MFQSGHRRGRSLCEELTLEETEKGGLVVSEISNSANQKLEKGDEIVGATIHFDELSKDDVLKLLKFIEPYDKKVELLSKKTKRPSKSLGTLDRCVKAPEEMLKDSYNRLYNDKIKKFIKGNTSGGAVDGSINREFKPRLKYDTECSIQGIDTNTTRVATPHFLNATNDPRGQNSLHIETPDIDIKTDPPNNDTPTNLNIPGLEQTRISNVSLPKTDLTVLDLITQKDNIQEKSCSPEESNITVPKGPKIDLTAPNLNINMPSVSFQTSNKLDSKLCNPGIIANTSSSKFKMPKLFGTLSKKTPELSLKAPIMKSGIDVPDIPKANLKELDLGTNTSNIDTDPLKSQLHFPKLRIPNFELPELNGHRNVDQDGHYDRPKLDIGVLDSDLDTESPLSNLKGPQMYLKKTEADVGSPGFSISGSNITLSKTDTDLKAPADNLNLEAPVDLSNIYVKAPQLDLNSPNVDMSSTQTKPKLKMPTFGMSHLKGPNVDIHGDVNAPDFHSPDLHISDSKIKGKINAPDLKPPTANLKGPKLDVSAPNMNFKMPSGKLSVPTLKKPEAELDALDFDVDLPSGKLKMPSFGFSRKQSERPNMDIDTGVKTPDLSLKAPHMKGGIDVPDMDLPTIDVKAPQLDLNSPNVDIGSPQTKFKLPKLKMPTFGMSHLKGPNVDIHGDVNATDFHSPDLHISDSKIKGKINAPDLKPPTANLKGPKLDVSAPNMNFKMPSGKLSVPTLKKPEAELDALDFDVDLPSGKLKMPSFGFSRKQPERPNMDIDTGVKTPDLSLKAPHMKGGIDVPDMDLPTIDVKAPQLDLNSPNVDIGSPQTKFKLPKLKMPTFGMSHLKGPNVDIHGDVNATDFHSPDLHISDPKIKGKINAPDVKLPTANLKHPKLDVSAPNMNLTMPSGKPRVPTLKKPKAEFGALDFDVDPPSGKLKMPSFGFSGKQPKRPNMDIDTGVKTPDLSLKAPHLKGGIDVPDMDLPNIDVKAPQLDLNSPNVDIGSPQTKFKIPKLKLPAFGMSGLKGPNVDIHGDVNAPDFHSPDLHISDPKIKGKINAPDVKLPTANLKHPKLDVSAPNMNLTMPSGKLRVPTLKKPKAEFGTLDFDVDPPSGKLKMPSFGFSGKQPKRPNMDIDTGVKTPDLSLKAPHLKGGIDVPDMDLPNIDVEAPQLDLNSPNVDIGSSQTKLKIPKLKMPTFGMSGLKGRNVDIHGDVNAPDFYSPDLHISDSKIRGKINAPDLKPPTANLKGPKLDVSAPNMNFKMPSSKLSIPTLKKPEAELDALDFDVDPPSGKLKMPSFGFSGKQPKRPNMDIDTGVKTPDLSLKAPHLKGGIDVPDMDLPNIDVKAPQLDLNSPNVDTGSPQTKFSFPKLKMPTFGMSHLKGPNVDIHGDVNAPDFHSPDLHISDSKMKGKINAPDLKLQTANLKRPKLDVSAPNMNLTMPSGKLRVPTLKKPKAEFGALDFDVDPPSGKLKMPSFGFSGKQPKIPNMDIDTGVKTPNLSLKAPHMKGGIDVPDMDLPNIDVKAPQLDLNSPNVDIGSPQTKFKIPKLKMPTFGMSGLKGPNVDIHGDVNAPDFHSPDLHLSDPKIKGKLNAPDLKLPTANLKGPKLDVNGPNMNFRGLNLTRAPSDTDFGTIMNSHLPDMNISPPKAKLDIRDIKDDFARTNHSPPTTNISFVDNGVNRRLANVNAALKPKMSAPELPFPKSYQEQNMNVGKNVDYHDHESLKKVPIHEIHQTKMKSKSVKNLKHKNARLHSNEDKSPEVFDGYYVTVFPKQLNANARRQTGISGNKASNHRGLDLNMSSLDLEVPEQNDLKGSTFWFSKLI